MHKIRYANPAPWGVLGFGLGCFVVGAQFAGFLGNTPGSMFGSAITAISTGVILTIVSALMLMGHGLQDDGQMSMWGAGIFGYFAHIWYILGFAMMFWQEGIEKPLAFMQIYTTLIALGYLYYAIKMKIASFSLMYICAVVATFAAFCAMYLGWTPGNRLCGYIFFFLGFLALWIALKEQLPAVLSQNKHESKEIAA